MFLFPSLFVVLVLEGLSFRSFALLVPLLRESPETTNGQRDRKKEDFTIMHWNHRS